LKRLSLADWGKLWKLFKGQENERNRSIDGSREGTQDLLPPGITDIRANPLTGSLVIQYDPKTMDILQYLQDMASNKVLQDLIEGEK
jgi:hypothetical protein